MDLSESEWLIKTEYKKKRQKPTLQPGVEGGTDLKL